MTIKLRVLTAVTSGGSAKNAEGFGLKSLGYKEMIEIGHNLQRAIIVKYYGGRK